MYKLSIRVLKKALKDNPGKTFTNKQGQTVTIEEVAQGLESVVKWIHPELTTEDIVRVVRCERCQHYKTYKKKGAFKATPFKACELDMKRRPPMFYCRDGESVETEDWDNEKPR